MAAITNIEITNFITKAQHKQIELASRFVDSDGDDEAAIELLTELSNCIDSLDSIYNTVSEDEIIRTIHHLSHKAKLNNYPVISFPNFNTSVNIVEHVIVDISNTGEGGGHTIKDSNGVNLAQRENLRFIGASATDDAENNQTIISIPAPDLSGKVDVVEGKGLSTEDYTTAEKIKLAGLSNTIVDVAPAEGSSNAVSSDGVHIALGSKLNISAVKQETGQSTTDVMSQKVVTDIVDMVLPESTPTGVMATLPTGRIVEDYVGQSRVNQAQYWGETSIKITPTSRFKSIKIKAVSAGNIKIGFLLVPFGGAGTILYQITKNIAAAGTYTFYNADILLPESVYDNNEVFVGITNESSSVSAINYGLTGGSSWHYTIATGAISTGPYTFPFSITTEAYEITGELSPIVEKVLGLETGLLNTNSRLDTLLYAVGKSAANNSAQLEEALLTNDYVEIGKGTHEFASSIILNSNKSIYGMGPATILKPGVGVNDLITVNTKSGVLIANLTLSGGGAAIDPASSAILPTAPDIETYVGKGLKRGIYSTKSTRLLVEKVFFTGWNWAGFYHDYPGANANNDAMLAGISGNNLYFDNCYAGLIMGTRGEYSRFDNLSAIKCIVGASIRAGNIIVANSHFTMSRIGIHIGSGENGAHGSINGCLINHNKLRGPYVHSVTNGHSFEGCEMFDSVLEIVNSKGVVWNGGIIAGAIIHSSSAASLNRVQNAQFLNGTYGSGTITETGTNSPISLKNNWFNDGSDSTAINN